VEGKAQLEGVIAVSAGGQHLVAQVQIKGAGEKSLDEGTRISL